MLRSFFLICLIFSNIVCASHTVENYDDEGSTIQIEQSYANAGEIEGSFTSKDDCPKNECSDSDCCQHCQQPHYIQASVKFIVTKIISEMVFYESRLTFTETSYEVIKPPML